MPYNTTSTNYRMPERIDHIWNYGLQVSALDVDYFNNESFPAPGGSPVDLGYDLQTVPFKGS